MKVMKIENEWNSVRLTQNNNFELVVSMWAVNSDYTALTGNGGLSPSTKSN